MKVYFSASPRGTNQHIVFYKKIFEMINALGFTHVDDDVIKFTYSDLLDSINQNPKAYIEYANKKLQSVQTSDICVFDVSSPSLGIGFLIERALGLGKPVILLHYYKDRFPFMFAGLQDEKLILCSYTEKNLNNVLKKSFNLARISRDRRFNFFINTRLIGYIEDKSREQGVTMSSFVRTLIIKHMHEDKLSVD